ncbi:MAG: HAD-IB family hydrolase [Acidimicrobiales bacterium]
MPRDVAAFDLDGTLTDGGSVFRWLRYLAGDATAYRAATRLLVPLGVGALLSGAHADDAKERLFRVLLAGRDAAEVAAASRAFGHDHFASHARAAVVARLRAHADRGDDVVVVSASPEPYVTVIAELVGASGALGTRLGVDASGRLTGGYDGRNCRGEEKLRRVVEWIAQRGDVGELYAYGNSRGDRRLLARADHPVDVGRLGRLGALRAFPRLGAAGPLSPG